MNRRSIIVVVACAAVILTVAVWNGRKASASTVQPDVVALSLVPSRATTLFGLDMDALRTSPVYGAWRVRAGERFHRREYTEFITRAGFDPERDLEGVTGAAWKEGDQALFLAVVTIRYNRETLAALLREKNATVESYRGFDLFGPPPNERRHGPPPALAFVDERTILAGAVGAVRQAVDLKLQPGPNVLSNAALVDRVRRIGAENQVWAVSSAPGSFVPQNLPQGRHPNALHVLQGLETSTFALNATSGLRLLAEGSCASDEDARLLAEAARGLLAMGRLFAPANRPEALDALNAFRVEQDLRDVRVTAEIPPQTLDQLFRR